MTLQKRSYLITFLFVGLGLLSLALILWSDSAQNTIRSELETVQAIRTKVGDLRTVGFEYALYHENRPRLQAEKVLRTLHPLFEWLRNAAEFQAEEPAGLWQDAFSRLTDCESLLALFAKETLNPLQQERERQMTNLFLMRAAALVTSVEQLSLPVFAQAQRVDRMREFVVFASVLILLGLPVVSIVLLRRAVLRPLNQLTGAV